MTHKEEEIEKGVAMLCSQPSPNIVRITELQAKVILSDLWDTATRTALQWRDEVKRPKIVCLCGSLRFKKEFGVAELRYVLNGWIVLTPCCMYVDAQRTDSFMEYKTHFDVIHKRKIDIADEVYVLNVDGYIGESTRSEIEHAEAHNKPVSYLEPLRQLKSGQAKEGEV